MDHGFRLRFDQMREGNPAQADGQQVESQEQAFHPPGYARNLCLVWPDGKRAFFNYAYLISAEFLPDQELNIIRLGFSAHQVTLKGYRLEALFMQLSDHLPKMVMITDPRYVATAPREESLVVSATVEASAV